jgi:hypothetical protein
MASGSSLLGTRLPVRISTPFGVASFPRIKPEMPREILVLLDETGRSDRSRSEPREEPVRQPRVTVVKCKEINRFGLWRHDSSSA